MKLVRSITLILTGCFSIFYTYRSLSICPVCSVAVGAGVGFTKWLGIDDSITGLWIGALTMSMIMWTINWLDKKNIKFLFRKILVSIIYYTLVIFPLCKAKFIGAGKLWGVDKLVLGIIIGSIAFLTTALSYEEMKRRNNGRAYFPLQKVVMPVAVLLILSLIFYFITKK